MKCLLVDDHALVRDALALLIALHHPDVDLRHAGRLREALAMLGAERDVDLVLLDLALPDSTGLRTLDAVRAAAPATRIVVLSADDRPATVLAAIDAGAAGYISKAIESRSLREALATVLHGGVYVYPPASPENSGLAGPSVSTDGLGLTPRQVDVLRMLVDGRSNKLIALTLGLSPSTVKTHLEAIFLRLQVTSRTQAVVAAARLGLRL